MLASIIGLYRPITALFIASVLHLLCVFVGHCTNYRGIQCIGNVLSSSNCSNSVSVAVVVVTVVVVVVVVVVVIVFIKLLILRFVSSFHRYMRRLCF